MEIAQFLSLDALPLFLTNLALNIIFSLKLSVRLPFVFSAKIRKSIADIMLNYFV